LDDDRLTFAAVCDGHGPKGSVIGEFLKERLPSNNIIFIFIYVFYRKP